MLGSNRLAELTSALEKCVQPKSRSLSFMERPNQSLDTTAHRIRSKQLLLACWPRPQQLHSVINTLMSRAVRRKLIAGKALALPIGAATNPIRSNFGQFLP